MCVVAVRVYVCVVVLVLFVGFWACWSWMHVCPICILLLVMCWFFLGFSGASCSFSCAFFNCVMLFCRRVCCCCLLCALWGFGICFLLFFCSLTFLFCSVFSFYCWLVIFSLVFDFATYLLGCLLFLFGCFDVVVWLFVCFVLIVCLFCFFAWLIAVSFCCCMFVFLFVFALLV